MYLKWKPDFRNLNVLPTLWQDERWCVGNVTRSSLCILWCKYVCISNVFTTFSSPLLLCEIYAIFTNAHFHVFSAWKCVWVAALEDGSFVRRRVRYFSRSISIFCKSWAKIIITFHSFFHCRSSIETEKSKIGRFWWVHRLDFFSVGFCGLEVWIFAEFSRWFLLNRCRSSLKVQWA